MKSSIPEKRRERDPWDFLAIVLTPAAMVSAIWFALLWVRPLSLAMWYADSHAVIYVTMPITFVSAPLAFGLFAWRKSFSAAIKICLIANLLGLFAACILYFFMWPDSKG